MPRRYTPWTKTEQELYAAYSSPDQLALALSSTSPDTREEARWLMRANPHVSYSAWDCFISAEYLLSRKDDIFFIGLQESLEIDFQTLVSKLGLPSTVKLLEKDSPYANSSRETEHVELDEEAIRNLETWYADDIEFYNLCKTLRSRLTPDTDPHLHQP